MSRNNAIPPLTRPPSSRANIIAAAAQSTAGIFTVGNDDRVAGEDGDRPRLVIPAETRVHDHSRPFPPPRLPLVHVTASVPSTPPPPPPPLPPPPPQVSQVSGVITTASIPGTPPPTSRIAPLTMPLTPLSSSFRSRPSLRRPQNVETSSSDANSRSLLSPSFTDAITTATTTILSSSRSPVAEVSLAAPRPDGERTINEYVEAPFKHSRCSQERRLDADSKTAGQDCPKAERRHHHHHHHHHRHHQGHDDTTVVPTHRARGRARGPGLRVFSGTTTGASPVATSASAAAVNAVTKQPVSFTKEPANTLGTRTGYDPAGLSIICDFCGRCRCESCREPPPLPSKWLCDNTCLCSAETILDYVSCLCCVKGLFYHCVDGGSGGGVVATGIDGETAAMSCADEPCSCTGNRAASRWACLSALTLVMPCLLCYWPLRGCVTVCEACYARHAAQGCRCNPNAATISGTGRHHPIADIGDSRDPEKRLLDPVTPEL